MVDAMPAQEPDATAVLEGQDPPAVDLLLVDPAVAMERWARERRRHGNQRESDGLGLVRLLAGRHVDFMKHDGRIVAQRFGEAIRSGLAKDRAGITVE